jgi:hypothetical protein
MVTANIHIAKGLSVADYKQTVTVTAVLFQSDRTLETQFGSVIKLGTQ